MTSPAALHSSATAEHYTPPAIVEAGRRALGRIDVDPFSSARANLIVKATSYADGENANGFVDDWAEAGARETAFVNSPGGKYKLVDGVPVLIAKGPGISGAALAWNQLLRQYAEDRIRSAIFVCFSLNVFQNSQRFGLPPCAFPFCMPAKRLRYCREDGIVGKSPPHPSAIVFVPNKDQRVANEEVYRFLQNFEAFGYCRT